MSKIAEYTTLVAARQTCHLCCDCGLTNPVDVQDGHFDWNQIGGWSRWQLNLNASLMVVGQDGGGTEYFVDHEGKEPPDNPTDLALVNLVGCAGVVIGPPDAQEGQNVVFFTNAILCLKSGGAQATVKQCWFNNCVYFLRRQIEIVHPKVVVGLGKDAYNAILRGFCIQPGPFLAEVEAMDGTVLPNGTRAFAVYHCGRRGQRHRAMDVQREDWRRIRPFVTNAG
jgi:hypothetical protein